MAACLDGLDGSLVSCWLLAAFSLTFVFVFVIAIAVVVVVVFIVGIIAGGCYGDGVMFAVFIPERHFQM